jgi:hypothetical protein
MIVIDDYPQLSEQWFAEILGNPGAHSFDNILTNVKGEPSKSALPLATQLAGEFVAGKQEESFSSSWMQRGIELESEARTCFEWKMDMPVREVAVCYPDEQKKYHCSPDGLLEPAGLEIKCPKLKTHCQYLLDGVFPKKDYNAQVQGSMLVTGLPHWYFMSYYPGLEPLIIKVGRHEEYIDKLRNALDKFCILLVKTIKRVKK